MAETDKADDTAPDAEVRQPPPPVEGNMPPLGDELEMEVLQGLAEEENSHVAPTGHPAAEPTLLLDAVKGMSDQLGRRLDLLQTTFERELRAEATRERVVDRLHAELQDYKQDFLLKVQRPIFIDLIQLHDDIGKTIDAAASQDIRAVLEPIQTAIEDILYRQGVEPFSLEGTEFDPRKQRAVSTQATDDPAFNKRVATRLRKGFSSGEKLIRPEIVSVFTFRPPA
jgi:molecular chaperone GrpE